MVGSREGKQAEGVMQRRSLPPFSFHRHEGSVVVDVESVDDIVRVVEEAAREVGSKAGGGLYGMVAAYIYSEAPGLLELRVWVSSEGRAFIVSNEERCEKPYKLMVETFIVKGPVALYDVEQCRAAGFRVVEASLGELGEKLAKALSACREERRAAGTRQLREAPAIPKPEEAPGGLSECIAALARACGEGRCASGGHPVKELLRQGIVVLARKAGSGSDYICIVREEGACRYLVVWVERGASRKACVQSLNQIREIINDALGSGFSTLTFPDLAGRGGKRG
jgi:hypothetical protein